MLGTFHVDFDQIRNPSLRSQQTVKAAGGNLNLLAFEVLCEACHKRHSGLDGHFNRINGAIRQCHFRNRATLCEAIECEIAPQKLQVCRHGFYCENLAVRSHQVIRKPGMKTEIGTNIHKETTRRQPRFKHLLYRLFAIDIESSQGLVES